MKRLTSLVFSLAVLGAAAAPALAQDAAPRGDEPGFVNGIKALVIGLVVAILALVISLWLAMRAVKMAIHMFDKTTDGIDEWTELGRGNVAVGIVLASMIVAVGLIISRGVTALTDSIMAPSLTLAFLVSLIVGVVNLLISLWIATTVIGLALKALDKATEKLEEMKEIQKGNVAVAIMVAGVLLAVSAIVGAAVEGFQRVLDLRTVAASFGWDLPG